jgi:hypothetical protein
MEPGAEPGEAGEDQPAEEEMSSEDTAPDIGEDEEGGASGVSGSMAEPLPSDAMSETIDVADGDFQVGDAPDTAGAEMVPVIVGLSGPPAVTNGGSATLLVTLATPVERPSFVVSLAGDRGFHTVTGTDSNGDGVYEITLQISGEAAQASLVLSVAATDASGNVGPYHEVTLELVQSGVGDVKVTLSFDRTHDLDLHVFEPMGEEIQFMNRASANGGQLDLDSGANCDSTTALSENVFWPPAQAPMGTYRVAVHNYEECTPGDIAYSVRIAYDNQVVIHRGTFAAGSAGSVAEVTTFTR